MQHQRPAKPQKTSFRTKEVRKRTPFNKSLLEHGDPNFKDLRIKKPPQKKIGFFKRLFS